MLLSNGNSCQSYWVPYWFGWVGWGGGGLENDLTIINQYSAFIHSVRHCLREYLRCRYLLGASLQIVVGTTAELQEHVHHHIRMLPRIIGKYEP